MHCIGSIPAVTRQCRCVQVMVWVCLVGAESVGKSRMSEFLGTAFGAKVTHEYGREYVEKNNIQDPGQMTETDLVAIMKGQVALEEAARSEAQMKNIQLMVTDTDVLVTSVWSEHLLGVCPNSIYEVAKERSQLPDLYILLDVTVPFHNEDGDRWTEGDPRLWFHQRFIRELDKLKLPHVVVSESTWKEREARCLQLVKDLLKEHCK